MVRQSDVLTAGSIGALVIVADQGTKVWAQGTLQPGRVITAVPGWLWFQLTANSGATLGLLRGHNLLFVAVSILVIVAVGVIVLRGAPGTLGAAALGAVAGGATSNLIDRARLGSVVDFIEIHFWPTDFNLADAAIRIGVVVFIATLVFGRRWRARAEHGSRRTG